MKPKCKSGKLFTLIEDKILDREREIKHISLLYYILKKKIVVIAIHY